jgi:PAS domain S-box-containing protein
MSSYRSQPYHHVLASNRKFAGIAALFLLTIAGLVLQTISSIQGRHVDGAVIDLTGRQRMLIERHLQEILLAAEGRPSTYLATRKLLTETLHALIHGGPAVLRTTDAEIIDVPPVPSAAIEASLREQEGLLQTLFGVADRFLQLPRGPQHDLARDNLLQLNARLMGVANHGVSLLTRQAEARSTSTIYWAVAVALATGLFGAFLTWQMFRANKKVATEILERARAEEDFQRSQTVTLKALRDSEERYRVLYEDNPSMYFTVTADGTVRSVNRFGTEQLGYRADELVGRSVLTVFHEEDRNKARQSLQTAFQAPDQVHQWELRKVRKDGQILWVREDVRIVRDGVGDPLALIVCDDITERHRAEEELRKSQTATLEALRHSDALKSALLSSVSHELRTPLTAIKAMVAEISDDGENTTPAARADVIERIHHQIDYLNKVIENLLDMSAIEAGRLLPSRDWHVLEELIEGALRRMGPGGQARQIEVRLDDDLPVVSVDALQIQRVLVNLLDNAVKYSSADSRIRLHAQRRRAGVQVQVSNGGETIPADQLQRVFDRFHRVQVARARPIPGSGLGLAICKAIIEAHGGRIWAQSATSETTITFTLPVTVSDQPAVALKGMGQEDRVS